VKEGHRKERCKNAQPLLAYQYNMATVRARTSTGRRTEVDISHAKDIKGCEAGGIK